MATTAESRPEIVERIARFLETGEGDFVGLALAAFAFQYERSAPYRRLCDGRGARPGELGGWREIPPVPATAFRSLDLATAPPREIFRSSGTTGGARGVHRHPFPDLYRRAIDAAFPTFCLPRDTVCPRDVVSPPRSPQGGGARLPVLSLIPPREQLPDSSLGFMADHILRRWGTPQSAVAFAANGVESGVATRWCASRRGGGPVLVLATAFALVGWLDAEPGADVELPAGSVVFETGGFKGRTREITRGELLELIGRRLGVPPSRVVREYGMTELTSQFYTRVLDGGDGDLFVELPWLRARLLDPVTLVETPPGEAGIVTIFDLANVGSAVHLMTQDLGVADAGGFRLLGRAGGAQLRGCSLTVEELESAELRTDSRGASCDPNRAPPR